MMVHGCVGGFEEIKESMAKDHAAVVNGLRRPPTNSSTELDPRKSGAGSARGVTKAGQARGEGSNCSWPSRSMTGEGGGTVWAGEAGAVRQAGRTSGGGKAAATDATAAARSSRQGGASRARAKRRRDGTGKGQGRSSRSGGARQWAAGARWWGGGAGARHPTLSDLPEESGTVGVDARKSESA